MAVIRSDDAVAAVASAIGEPARTRMLLSLVDGRARTSTELAVVADVTPSTASVHLSRLLHERLVRVVAQGKHRYYSLAGTSVAAALETLCVLAAESREFIPTAPEPLRMARTCYDHLAGTLGVLIHDRFTERGWLVGAPDDDGALDVTPAGAKALGAIGIDVDATRAERRRFAFACLDWSERRAHIGGSLGAALLRVALKKRWVAQELDSRALTLTRFGERELRTKFDLTIPRNE
jgi:DNA-binding transcriptional ArsR family regulator